MEDLIFPAKLAAIAEKLRCGEAPEPVTVRTLLSWFNAQRRSGHWQMRLIRHSLSRYGLRTLPDLESTYLDGELHFALVKPDDAKPTPTTTAPEAEPVTEKSEVIGPAGVSEDPTFRLARLPSANKTPISVSPHAPLATATTLMIHHDYSQLPVMEGDFGLKGVISWASMGKRLALGVSVKAVRECMEPAHVVERDTSLFSAIETIVRHDYVLVRHPDNRIGGIVTTADLSLQFQQLAEPYLRIGEIENHLRPLIASHFSADELKALRAPNDPEREILQAGDLTFGDYVRLLESEERWQRVELNLDRKEFVRSLEEIRKIRNDVMHFDPDPIQAEDLTLLRNFTRLMQTLKQIGAV